MTGTKGTILLTDTMRLTDLMLQYTPGDEHSWEAEFSYLWYDDVGRLLEVIGEVMEFGIETPIDLGPDGRVWDGHHRIAAAVELGLSYVPVNFISSVDENQRIERQMASIDRAVTVGNAGEYPSLHEEFCAGFDAGWEAAMEGLADAWDGGWERGNAFALESPTLNSDARWSNPYRKEEK